MFGRRREVNEGKGGREEKEGGGGLTGCPSPG